MFGLNDLWIDNKPASGSQDPVRREPTKVEAYKILHFRIMELRVRKLDEDLLVDYTVELWEQMTEDEVKEVEAFVSDEIDKGRVIYDV